MGAGDRPVVWCASWCDGVAEFGELVDALDAGVFGLVDVETRSGVGQGGALVIDDGLLHQGQQPSQMRSKRTGTLSREVAEDGVEFVFAVADQLRILAEQAGVDLVMQAGLSSGDVAIRLVGEEQISVGQ